ncbi:MAG: FAD-binding protein, partial [Candidatus Omnitrophica bacterium]|nr:FAD-binding protein [Candidatus Omnitrophota bacterium]
MAKDSKCCGLPRRGHYLAFRLAGLVIAQIFLLTSLDISWAAPQRSFFSKRNISQIQTSGRTAANPTDIQHRNDSSYSRIASAHGAGPLPLDPASVDLPAELGRVVERQIFPGSSQVVVYIQDVHAHPEAQENIAQILKYLNQAHGVKQVALEGSAGPILTFFFSSIPDGGVRQRWAEQALNQAIITGPEKASIAWQLPLDLYGVENREQYIEDYLYFRQMHTVPAEWVADMEALSAQVEAIQEATLSPKALELLRAIAGRATAEGSMTEYVRLLSGLAGAMGLDLESQYPAVWAFAQVQKLQPELEAALYKEETRSLLARLIKARAGEEGVQDLMKAAAGAAGGRLAAGELAVVLQDWIAEEGLAPSEYPQILKAAEFHRLSEKLQPEQVLAQSQELEARVLAGLLRSEEEQQVYALGQNVGLLMSVLEGDAAPEEWRKYQEKRAQLDPGQLCKTAETLAQRCGVELSKTVCEQALTAWKSWADGAEGFYQVAEARNESLVSNTLAWMKEGDAVLLTGGFHTEGITELLARRGISYVVVAPRVTQFAGPDLYLERMLAYDVGAAKPQNTFASVARADSLATMHLLAANPALDPEGFAGIIRQQAEVVLEMFGELSQTQRAIRLREWHGLLRERIAADANSSRPYFTDPQIIPRYLQILSQLETELWGLPQQLESAGENSASVPENGRHPLILDGHPELLNAPEPASLPGGLFAELQGLLGSDLTRESLQVLLDNLIFGGVKEPEQGQHSESANSAVDLLQAAETLGESVRLMSALSEAELQATSLLVKYLSGDSDSSALLALIDLVRTINQSLYSDALTKEFSAEAQALIIDFVWSHYPEFSELTNAAVFDELDRRLQETSDPTIEAVQDALFSGTRLLDLVGEGTEEEMGGKVESYWDKVLGDERLAKFAPPRQRETELDPEWQDLLDSLAGHLRDSQILTDPMALLQVYNQDLAKMPSAFNLVYDTKPDAAVRVRSEDDLIRIVQFARAHHINLIPRGRASAALGGAIPTDPSKRNLVLDLFELNSIKVEAIQIEPGQSDRMILTVGPTATFDVIQAKLDEHNRAVVDDAVEEIMRNVVGVGLSTPAGQAFKETYGLDYAAVEELLKQYVRQKKKLDDGLNNFILALQGGPASLKRLDAIRDQELHRLSLDNHCPSNPAGGVAGWISNGEPGVGGLGINNYRYGSALQAIESMRVLTGAGKIEELKRGDPRLQDFVGTGGRFGIILEVQLRLHRMQGASPRLARFESGEEAMAFVQEVTKKPGMDPTHVMYEQHHGESGPEHQVLLNFDDAEQAQQFDEYFEDYAKSPRIRKVSFWAALKGALTQPGLRKIGALGDHFLYFVFKHQNSVRHERIAGYAGITPRIASPTLAGWQEAFDKWDERLRPMKARNLGDMYTSEVVMPLDRVSGYLGQVNRMTRGLRTLRRLPRAPAAPDLGVELDTLAVAEHILSQPLPILESDSALNGLKASLKITLEFLQTPLHRQSPNWRQDQLSLLNRQIELYRKAELLAVAQISESQEIPVSPGSDVLVGKQRAIQNILEELRALPREGKSNFRPERRGELMLRLEEELDSYSILRSEVTGQTRDWAPLLRRVPEVTVEKMDAQEIEAVLPRAARRGRKFFGRSRQADLRIRVNDATQIDFIVRTAQRFGRPVVLSTNPQASMGQAVSGREYLLIDVSQISEIGNPDELIQGLVRYNETLERPQHLEIHGKAYVTAVHDAAGNVTGYEAMVSPEFLSDSRDFLSFHMDAVITKVNMLAAVLFHEARPYGHGLFFTDFLRRALGQEHMHRLQNARKEYDPDNIMNPGKVTEMKTRGRNLPSRFAFGPLGWTLMTAYRFTVMLAPVRNSVIRTIDWSRRVGGKELVRYVEELWAEQETCIRCSACTTVCPIAQIMMNSRDPWLMKRAFDVTPEGRLRLMRKHLSGQKLTFDELFSFVACLRCGVAEQEHICPIGDQLLANYGEVLGVGESKELVAYDALEQQLRAEGYPVDDAIRLFGDALRNHPGVQMAMEDLYGARGTPVDPSSSIHAPPLSQFPQWQVHVDESICINCTLCGIDDPKVAERIQHPEDPDRRKMVTLDELLRATGGRIPARWFKKHGGTLPNNLPQVRNGERSLESVGRGMVQNVRRNGNTVEMDVFVEQGHVARAGFVRDWRENAWQTSQDEVKGLVQEVGRVTVSGMQIDEEDGNVVLDVELENGRLAWGTFLEIGEGRAVRIAEIRQPKNRGQGFVEVEEVFSREQGTVRAQVVLEGVSVEELAALRGDSVRVLQRNERKHVRRLSTVGIQGAEGSVPLVRRYKGAAAVATVSFNVSADQDLPYQTGDSVEFFEEVTQVEAQSGDVGCTACQKCAKNCPAGTVHGLPHGAIHIEPDEYFLELWGADYEPAEIARITEEANSITSLKSGMGTASVHARVRTTAWRRWLMRDREVEIPFSAREQHLRLAAGLNPAEVDEAPPVNERWAGLNRFVFDLSVIVRPTRDGLRESISFRLSLGRRLAFQVYDRLRQILGGRFPGMITRMQGVHLNMPLLFEVPVIEGTRSADGTGLAQQRTGEVAEIMARSAYLEGSLVLIEIEDFIRNYEALMPYAENISLRVRGGSLGRALDEVRKRQNDFPGFDTVLAKLPMIEIVDDDQYGEDSQRSVAEVLNQAKALQRIVRGFPAEAEVSPARLPQISILLQPRVGTDHEMIAQRALAFANAGADILHIKSPFNAAATDYETARLIPTVYEALKSEGRHQQVPIIASGGIKQAADIGVTMMLGATAVVADRTPLVALDHEMPRLDREGRERIEPFNIDEGVERLHNLTHSWLDQFQEVLGAFGVRDVRRIVGDRGRLIDLREQELKLHDTVTNPDHAKRSQKVNAALLEAEGELMRANTWTARGLLRLVRSVAEPEERLTVGWGEAFRVVHELKGDKRWTKDLLQSWYKLASGEWTYAQLRDRYGTERVDTGQDIGAGSLDNLQWVRVQRTDGEGVSLGRSVSLEELSAERRLQFVNPETGLIDIDAYAEWIDGQKRMEGDRREPKPVNLSPGWENQHAQPKEVVKNGETVREPAEKIVPRSILHFADMSVGSIGYKLWFARNLAAAILQAHMGSGEGGLLQSLPNVFSTRVVPGFQKNTRLIQYLLRRSGRWIATQVATGFFGVKEDTLAEDYDVLVLDENTWSQFKDLDELAHRIRTAKEVVIKYGQGAKPGLGGKLPGSKNREPVSTYRGTSEGIDLDSPFPFHNVYSIEDHRKHVDWFRALNPQIVVTGKIPTPVDTYHVCKGMVEAGVDVIQIDGTAGGTGAAPQIAKDRIAMALEQAVVDAHRFLVQQGVRNTVKIRASGGLRTSQDVLKIIALGADEVMLGTGEIVAVGCNRCTDCTKGCDIAIANSNQLVESQRDLFATTQNIINGQSQVLFDVAASLQEMYQAGLITEPSTAALRGRWDLIDPDSWGWTEDWTGISPADR